MINKIQFLCALAKRFG